VVRKLKYDWNPCCCGLSKLTMLMFRIILTLKIRFSNNFEMTGTRGLCTVLTWLAINKPSNLFETLLRQSLNNFDVLHSLKLFGACFKLLLILQIVKYKETCHFLHFTYERSTYIELQTVRYNTFISLTLSCTEHQRFLYVAWEERVNSCHFLILLQYMLFSVRCAYNRFKPLMLVIGGTKAVSQHFLEKSF